MRCWMTTPKTVLGRPVAAGSRPQRVGNWQAPLVVCRRHPHDQAIAVFDRSPRRKSGYGSVSCRRRPRAAIAPAIRDRIGHSAGSAGAEVMWARRCRGRKGVASVGGRSMERQHQNQKDEERVEADQNDCFCQVHGVLLNEQCADAAKKIGSRCGTIRRDRRAPAPSLCMRLIRPPAGGRDGRRVGSWLVTRPGGRIGNYSDRAMSIVVGGICARAGGAGVEGCCVPRSGVRGPGADGRHKGGHDGECGACRPSGGEGESCRSSDGECGACRLSAGEREACRLSGGECGACRTSGGELGGLAMGARPDPVHTFSTFQNGTISGMPMKPFTFER